MKAIKTLTLGLLSAAFLAIGFSKFAKALDPLSAAMQTHGTRVEICSATVTCSLPCMKSDKSDRTS